MKALALPYLAVKSDRESDSGEWRYDLFSTPIGLVLFCDQVMKSQLGSLAIGERLDERMYPERKDLFIT